MVSDEHRRHILVQYGLLVEHLFDFIIKNVRSIHVLVFDVAGAIS